MNKILLSFLLLFVFTNSMYASSGQDTVIIGPPAFNFDTLLIPEKKLMPKEVVISTPKPAKPKLPKSQFSIINNFSIKIDSAKKFYDLSFLVGEDSILTNKESFRDKYFEQFRSDSYDYARVAKQISKSVNPNIHIERIPKSNWITFLFLFIACLVIFITKAFNKNFQLLTSGFLKDRSINQVSRDESVFYSISTLFLFLLFLLASGLLLFNMSNYYQWNIGYQQFSRFIYFIVILSIYYLAKVFVLKLSGIFFEVQKPINSYLMIINIVNTLFSLLFIPLLLVYNYAPEIFTEYLPIIFTVLVVALLIYQIVRSSVFIISNFRLPIMYLFIYLCTLEILPILLFVTVFR